MIYGTSIHRIAAVYSDIRISHVLKWKIFTQSPPLPHPYPWFSLGLSICVMAMLDVIRCIFISNIMCCIIPGGIEA